MTERSNIIVIGATRKGKTLGEARRIIEATDEAAAILDPHNASLAQEVLTHAEGNILYDRLSDLTHALGYDMLKPSTHRDPMRREMENQLKAEAFVGILLRRREADSLAGTPLMEEWLMAALMLYLNQEQGE